MKITQSATYFQIMQSRGPVAEYDARLLQDSEQRRHHRLRLRGQGEEAQRHHAGGVALVFLGRQVGGDGAQPAAHGPVQHDGGEGLLLKLSQHALHHGRRLPALLHHLLLLLRVHQKFVAQHRWQPFFFFFFLSGRGWMGVGVGEGGRGKEKK